MAGADHGDGSDGEGAGDHLAHAYALGDPSGEIGEEQSNLAERDEEAARLLAEIALDHEQRAIDEEGRPEARAAEGDEPGEPEARLADEAADIGERVLRCRSRGPDD